MKLITFHKVPFWKCHSQINNLLQATKLADSLVDYISRNVFWHPFRGYNLPRMGEWPEKLKNFNLGMLAAFRDILIC